MGADGYVQQPHGHSQRHRPVRPDQNGSRQRGKQDRTVNESDLYCAYLLSKNVIKKKQDIHIRMSCFFLAEMEGFEPPHALRRLPDFESGPFSHLGTSPSDPICPPADGQVQPPRGLR